MAHKTLVGGTAYEIKGGRCLVNGTGYAIKKGRTMVSGTGYDIGFGTSYDPIFSNNDWSTIIQACQNNEVPDTWEVGNQKAMSINGTDYMIDIIGRKHDTYAVGGGKAPLTFQMHNCYSEAYVMNNESTNAGGWQSSTMRISTIPLFKSYLPQEVRNGIKSVVKNTPDGSKSSTLITTHDDIFLLSPTEATADDSWSYDADVQYEYYAAGNSLEKHRGDTSTNPVRWWLRSPLAISNTKFMTISLTATLNNLTANTSSAYAAFAFCF